MRGESFAVSRLDRFVRSLGLLIGSLIRRLFESITRIFSKIFASSARCPHSMVRWGFAPR